MRDHACLTRMIHITVGQLTICMTVVCVCYTTLFSQFPLPPIPQTTVSLIPKQRFSLNTYHNSITMSLFYTDLLIENEMTEYNSISMQIYKKIYIQTRQVRNIHKSHKDQLHIEIDKTNKKEIHHRQCI